MSEKLEQQAIANDEWHINKNPALLKDENGKLMAFDSFAKGIMKFIHELRMRAIRNKCESGVDMLNLKVTESHTDDHVSYISASIMEHNPRALYLLDIYDYTSDALRRTLDE